VREPGGELADGGETLGPFQLLEAFLKLPVYFPQLFRRRLQLVPPLPFPIRQDTGDDADQEENHNLGILIRRVVRVPSPRHQDVGDVAHRGAGSRREPSGPPEGDGGKDDRQVVQPLEDVVPKEQRGRGRVMAGRNQQDGAGNQGSPYP